MCLNEGFSSKNFTRIWLAAICASSGFDQENGIPAGFCYQRLSIAQDFNAAFSIYLAR